MKQEVEKQKKNYPDKKVNYYIVLRNSSFWLCLPEIKFCCVHAFFSESAGVFYSYFVGIMIRYIKDDSEDSNLTYGIQLIAIFFFAQLFA